MTSYATDEDIALRASADFAALCPVDQAVASGSDGVFLASDPWTLLSGSVNFAALGLGPGLIVRLSKPASAFGPTGVLFAVASAASGGITLRRKGQPAGLGQPASPAAGVVGVEFSIRTLGPQIALASYDLAQRFGIDDSVAGRRSVDLADPGQLREAAVLSVLARQYLDQARQFAGPSDAPEDWYSAKARIARADLDDVLDRLTLRWGVASPAGRPADTTRFSSRLSR